MDIDGKISIMDAFRKGESVQYRRCGEVQWHDCNGGECFDFADYEYRMKPSGDDNNLMTNRQLSELLAKGYGQVCYKPFESASIDHAVPLSEENEEVSETVSVRPWSSDQWLKPTVDIYEEYMDKWNSLWSPVKTSWENLHI